MSITPSYIKYPLASPENLFFRGPKLETYLSEPHQAIRGSDRTVARSE